ncbi:hypothetical protein EUGRSUZ_I00486 [Eucalyptus grandis]|uniref:Uncharacterized protein n=2 Tax=Eucalyptus grandis TaxID=71139 RepID=A0ACC3JCT9_EUCGR|nr:hypothetical protein EUGRSUZ_I00486 [Eucalyptus grandis]
MCTKLRYIRTPPCSFVDVETASASPWTHIPMRKHGHTSICSYLKAHKDHMQTLTSLHFNKTLEPDQLSPIIIMFSDCIGKSYDFSK